MNVIHLETSTLHAHEVGESAVLEGLSEFLEHMIEHRFPIPDSFILRDAAGKFTARFAVHDNATRRRVTLTEFVDLH